MARGLSRESSGADSSQPSQVEVVESDAETEAPPSDDVMDFNCTVMYCTEELEDFRLIAASWLQRLRNHKYMIPIKADLDEFVTTLTMDISRLSHLVHSGDSLLMTYKERKRMLQSLTTEVEEAFKKWTTFKSLTNKMLPDEQEDEEAATVVGEPTVAVPDETGELEVAEDDVIAEPMSKKAKKDD